LDVNQQSQGAPVRSSEMSSALERARSSLELARGADFRREVSATAAQQPVQVQGMLLAQLPAPPRWARRR
jgi:hypothetical protein